MKRLRYILFIAALLISVAPAAASAQVYGSYGYAQPYTQTITTPYWCGSYWSSYPCTYQNYGYQYQPYYNTYNNYYNPYQYQYNYNYGYCPQGYYYSNGLCYPNNYYNNGYYNNYNNYYQNPYMQQCYHTSAPWYGPSYQYPCYQTYW